MNSRLLISVLGALAPVAAPLASVSVESTAWLVDQVLRAEDGENTEVARDALNKLLLIEPDSEGILLKSFQTSLKDGTNPDRARRLLADLCKKPSSSRCAKARELERFYAPQNKETVQMINLLLAAGQYQEALNSLEKLFGGIPEEDSLRLFYYETMMKIPKEHLEALDGFESLLKKNKNNPFVQAKVRRVLRENRILQLSDFGLDRIYDEKDRELAEKALTEVLRLDPMNSLAPRWRAALLESRFWSNLRLADQSLEGGDLQKAKRYYQEAIATNIESPYAYMGLADVALRENKFSQARRYVDLALLHAAKESAEEKNRIASKKTAIDLAEIEWKIARLEQKGQFAEVLPLLRSLQKLDAKNPWLAYRIGSYLDKYGKTDEALRVFDGFSAAERTQSDVAYPYALLLSALGKSDEALKVLMSVKNPTRDIRDLRARLEDDAAVTKARLLAKEGKLEEAVALLKKLSDAPSYVQFFLADSLVQLKRFSEAEEIYLKLAQKKDTVLEARLRLAALYVESARKDEAGMILSWFAKQAPRTVTPEDWIEVISLYERLEDNASAEKLYRVLFKDLQEAFKGDRAVFFRNYGRLLVREHRGKEALEVYRAGFSAKEMASQASSDEEFTAAMRTPDEPDSDWVRSSLRRDAAELYQKENTVLWAGLSVSRDKGSAGYSDVTSLTNILEVETPYKGGRLRLRQDNVFFGVGSLPSAGRDYTKFGYCYGALSCEAASPINSDFGASYALAWERGNFGFDIGTTPIGFRYVDPVGSVYYKFENSIADATVKLYRRAKDSSLLAFGGQRDPNTGITWGGVRRNGLEVSFSRPLTDASGLWAFANVEYITGRSVASNTALQAMIGYYHHLLDKPNHRVSFGTSSFFWHFQKNLSGYTVGQGGYYSPKLSLSQSVSLSDVGRTENWAWDVQGRLSYGHSRVAAGHLYPLGIRGLNLTAGENIEEGSQSNTLSFGIRGAVERRLGAHFVLGAASEYQNADGYTPFIAMLYLRYYWHAWRGDLPLGITAPSPYSRW